MTIQRNSLILLIGLLFTVNLVSAQWLTDFEAAKTKALKEQKLILLNFSGSDWCAPCIRLKKEVFNTEAFQSYAAEYLVMINADFPRKKANRLSDELTAHNEKLAEAYNQKGSFPLTVLLNHKGEKLAEWEGMPTDNPADMISILSPLVQKNKLKGTSGARTYKRTLLLMGSRFDFSIVAENEAWAQKQLDLGIAEVQRIEKLISSWDENSQTSAINRNAGIAPVKVDAELLNLIERSKKISDLTQGAFDISFGSIDKSIWKFDGSMTALPSEAEREKSVQLINYKNIITNASEQTVFLKDQGMRIGFGAIGKGYAAEKVKALWQANGVKSGVVNAGGDLTAWGKQPNGKPWTIGIANPDAKSEAFSWLEITDQAVVTSGNYEKFVEINGTKYTHIIDPRSGMPVSGTKSVTIFSPNAELADALATAVFVMGPEVGLDLVNQLPGIECLIVNEDGQLFTSVNLKLNHN